MSVETVIEAGAVRFVVERREFGGDRGPAIRVMAAREDTEVQLLRFDCFARDPHYHYDPNGRNCVLHLHPEEDSVAWAIDHIERNLKVMVRLAGYADIADQLDADAVQAALPRLRRALYGA